MSTFAKGVLGFKETQIPFGDDNKKGVPSRRLWLGCLLMTGGVVIALSSKLRCAAQVPSVATGQSSVANQIAGTPAKPPSYDVVTIRPNNQGPGSMRVSINMDTLLMTNQSLDDLLRNAYDLRPGMLSGEPKWADDMRFDIHAKVLDADTETLKNLKAEDRRRMLRDLLADRFHLQVHTEVKTLPVYELLQAKGGTKLADIPSEHRNDEFHGTSSGGMSMRDGMLTGHYMEMKRFADTMSYQVDRTVIDKTGMPGHYNIQLNWARDDAPAGDEAAAPPLFKALEEQLGLKLVAAKDPVETIVVDHAELPTEN